MEQPYGRQGGCSAVGLRLINVMHYCIKQGFIHRFQDCGANLFYFCHKTGVHMVYSHVSYLWTDTPGKSLELLPVRANCSILQKLQEWLLSQLWRKNNKWFYNVITLPSAMSIQTFCKLFGNNLLCTHDTGFNGYSTQCSLCKMLQKTILLHYCLISFYFICSYIVLSLGYYDNIFSTVPICMRYYL